MLATQSIKARARQGGRASLYDWIVYKRGSKAKERRGEERQRRSKLYTICKSRDCNCLPFTAVIYRNLPQSAVSCQCRNNRGAAKNLKYNSRTLLDLYNLLN